MVPMPDLVAKMLWIRGIRPWTRHSLVLMVAGLMYAMVGISYLVTGLDDTRKVSVAGHLQFGHKALGVFDLDASDHAIWTFYAVNWIIVGALAMISSRWPPASETWGYTAMCSFSTFWSGCYLLSLNSGSPDRVLSGALVWALLAFLWWAISGLVNPRPPKTPVYITIDAHNESVTFTDDDEDARR